MSQNTLHNIILSSLVLSSLTCVGRVSQDEKACVPEWLYGVQATHLYPNQLYWTMI